MSEENIHTGYRDRMIKRLIESPYGFSDHELLEVLLYPVILRRDTNPLAHKLINVFGSVRGVLGATPKELKNIYGVGEKTACYLSLIGTILKRVEDEGEALVKPSSFNFEGTLRELKEYFSGCYGEKFIIRLFDKDNKLLSTVDCGGQSSFSFEMNTEELVLAISHFNPKSAIIAHNHLSGTAEPSLNDDISTFKILGICKLHGVRLLDHVIIAKDKSFSYFCSKRLENINLKLNFEDIIREFRENSNE